LGLSDYIFIEVGSLLNTFAPK